MVKYIGVIKCADCGEELNRTTKPLTEKEKIKATVNSCMNAGPCPKGCRSTFKDLNINTRLEWEEVTDETD